MLKFVVAADNFRCSYYLWRRLFYFWLCLLFLIGTLMLLQFISWIVTRCLLLRQFRLLTYKFLDKARHRIVWAWPRCGCWFCWLSRRSGQRVDHKRVALFLFVQVFLKRFHLDQFKLLCEGSLWDSRGGLLNLSLALTCHSLRLVRAHQLLNDWAAHLDSMRFVSSLQRFLLERQDSLLWCQVRLFVHLTEHCLVDVSLLAFWCLNNRVHAVYVATAFVLTLVCVSFHQWVVISRAFMGNRLFLIGRQVCNSVV